MNFSEIKQKFLEFIEMNQVPSDSFDVLVNDSTSIDELKAVFNLFCRKRWADFYDILDIYEMLHEK